MVFRIEPAAIMDIQNEIDYYNSKQIGLGKKFLADLNRHFKAIRKNPFFQVRYDNIRCLPMKKFPVMIHFTLDENLKLIIIRAVINTYKDPKTYWVQ